MIRSATGEIIPEEHRQAYDVKQIISRLVDEGSFFELQPDFAPNLVIGFARLAGMVVGLVANQPLHLAGALDLNASDKGGRFIRTYNVFNIPLLTLVDVPGFLPGVSQEHGGIIRHGSTAFTCIASRRPRAGPEPAGWTSCCLTSWSGNDEEAADHREQHGL